MSVQKRHRLRNVAQYVAPDSGWYQEGLCLADAFPSACVMHQAELYAGNIGRLRSVVIRTISDEYPHRDQGRRERRQAS